MSGLTISISNFAPVKWTQTSWVCQTGDSGGLGDNDEITEAPSLTIDANDGNTTAAANQNDLEKVTQDALWMQTIYKDPNGNMFGVHCNQNFQEFSIGPGDDWGYWGTKGTWHNEGENSQARTLTFPCGMTVIMTPTMGHQSASVTVQISPAPIPNNPHGAPPVK